MSFFQRVFQRKPSVSQDANEIYAQLMRQSRNPVFFGVDKIPDSYDGRLELLTIHLSAFMWTLSKEGPNGQHLSQGLFDVFVEDLDIALREEGLTDSGVKRRIKPMVGLFYARLKEYGESFESSADSSFAISEVIGSGAVKTASKNFMSRLSAYVAALKNDLQDKNLHDLTQAPFNFPEFKE